MYMCYVLICMSRDAKYMYICSYYKQPLRKVTCFKLYCIAFHKHNYKLKLSKITKKRFGYVWVNLLDKPIWDISSVLY